MARPAHVWIGIGCELLIQDTPGDRDVVVLRIGLPRRPPRPIAAEESAQRVGDLDAHAWVRVGSQELERGPEELESVLVPDEVGQLLCAHAGIVGVEDPLQAVALAVEVLRYGVCVCIRSDRAHDLLVAGPLHPWVDFRT